MLSEQSGAFPLISIVMRKLSGIDEGRSLIVRKRTRDGCGEMSERKLL